MGYIFYVDKPPVNWLATKWTVVHICTNYTYTITNYTYTIKMEVTRFARNNMDLCEKKNKCLLRNLTFTMIVCRAHGNRSRSAFIDYRQFSDIR